MRSSLVIAGTLAVVAVGWIASGQIGGSDRTVNARNGAETVAAPEKPLVSVRVRTLTATQRNREISINGRTAESRRVVVRAETVGPVAETGIEEGRPVGEGQVIARLGIEDRQALLAEAQALEKQRNIEYNAATELARKGFRSGTKLAEALAQLEAAQARTKSVRIDLERTEIRAPFDAVLEKRHVEKGDFVQKGDQVATVVDLDPLLAVGFVSERDIADVKTGSPGSVRLINGQQASGTVRYVGSVADEATRSFRVELEIPNPDYAVRAGLTVELRLPLDAVSAHLVSPAWLTLAEDGTIGLRTVEASDVVAFVPVRIVGDTPEGLWVTGLGDEATVITVGHEFVKAGQKVRPVPDTAEAAS